VGGNQNVPKQPSTAPHIWKPGPTGRALKIPAPKTGNWVKAFGGWNGFTAEIHRSIGRKLGSGTLKLSRTTSPARSSPHELD